MPLHPQVLAFLEEQRSQDLKPLEQCSPEQFREMLRVGSVVTDQPETVESVEDRQIDGPNGSIPIRIYRPKSTKPLGAIVYYHGGGWVGGDLNTHDPLCRAIANAANSLLIAVDYRLAPEHKYPAAAEDAYASFLWAQSNASELEISPQRIGVCGDSAGGNLAAVVSLMARDQGQPLPCIQILIYPIVDRDFATSSYQEYAEGYSLTAAGMIWFWEHYLSDPSQASQAYAAPLKAEKLTGLPSALVVTAQCDVLCTEGEQYAARLQAAGVPTELTGYDGMIHGFVSRVQLFDAARDAVKLMAAAFQKSLPS